MGSWNKTCGLTGLPITYDEDVLVFPIIESPKMRGRCYSTALWSPMNLCFASKYNDYGGGEKSDEIMSDIIINLLRNDLVELEQGENEYHDIPITREKFDEEMFFNGVHEQRLLYSVYRRPLDFVMMKRSSVDYILENYRPEIYVGDGKGNIGYGNNYYGYSFQELLDDAHKFLSHFRQSYEKSTSMNDDNPIYKEISNDDGYKNHKDVLVMMANWQLSSDRHHYSLEFEDHMDNPEGRLAANWINFSDGEYNYFMNNEVRSLLKHMITRPSENDDHVLKYHLISRFVDSFMDSVRKVWVPACHEGSQATIGREYLILSDLLRKEHDDYMEQREY